MEVKSLDFYCERLSDAFWAEPVNAWTNLGFVFVGLCCLYLCFRLKSSAILKVFSFFLILIGVGSFLFHTFADNRFIVADLAPIFIFTCLYIYHSLRRYISLSELKSYGGLFLVVGFMVFSQILIPREVLNGSLLYVPPLAMLIWISFQLRKKTDNLSPLFFAAAGVFFFSIVMRSLDNSICEFFPLGTHFLWHMGNAVFLGILMRIAFLFDSRHRSL